MIASNPRSIPASILDTIVKEHIVLSIAKNDGHRAAHTCALANPAHVSVPRTCATVFSPWVNGDTRFRQDSNLVLQYLVSAEQVLA